MPIARSPAQLARRKQFKKEVRTIFAKKSTNDLLRISKGVAKTRRDYESLGKIEKNSSNDPHLKSLLYSLEELDQERIKQLHVQSVGARYEAMRRKGTLKRWKKKR